MPGASPAMTAPAIPRGGPRVGDAGAAKLRWCAAGSSRDLSKEPGGRCRVKLRRRSRTAASASQTGGSSSVRGGAADAQADLLRVLAEAIFLQQRNIATSAISSAGTTLERAWKLLEPLPAGMPPGPATDAGVALIQNPLEFLEDMTAQHGRAVGLKIAGERVMLISDPELAREVLVTQADVFIKAGTAFFPGSSLAGNGLLVSDGDVWRRQRRLSNPAFRKSAIAAYSLAMIELTEDLVRSQWRAGGVRDVYEDFNKLTLDITVSALFGGIEASGAHDARYQQSLDQVGPAISTAFTFFTRRATTMFAIPEWLPTPDNIQYNLAVARLDRLVYRLISDRRRALAEDAKANGAHGGQAASGDSQDDDLAPGARSDLLTQLLQARDEDGSDMDDVALRDELMTLLVAGQETSAILLGWTSVMLALNPEVQERAREEVEALLQGRTPTHSDAFRLKYVEAVVWETLRLMPPAYLVGRCACRDAQLGPWRLQQGTTVLVSPFLLHRDPAFWPRSESFDPSRWLEGGDAEPQSSNDSFWPFGGGPRNCIGMGFALMEALLVLAIILQHFRLELPPGGRVPQPQALITLRPQGRVDLKLVPLR